MSAKNVKDTVKFWQVLEIAQDLDAVVLRYPDLVGKPTQQSHSEHPVTSESLVLVKSYRAAVWLELTRQKQDPVVAALYLRMAETLRFIYAA